MQSRSGHSAQRSGRVNFPLKITEFQALLSIETTAWGEKRRISSESRPTLWNGRRPAATKITSSAASQHLRVLREAHLVRMRRDGNRHLYSLDPRGLNDARDYLDKYWPSALAAHAAALREAADADPAQPTRR